MTAILLTNLLLGSTWAGSEWAGDPSPFGHQLREKFMVSPNLTTFNHGGYGATPKPVFDAQLGYMREMEADIGVWMNGTLRDSAQF